MADEPFELTFSGYFPDTLRVLWFRGREAVSALYDFEVCVACRPGPESSFEQAVLERPLSLRIRAAAAPRAIHGIAAAASLESVAAEGERIHLVRLVPRFWLAKKRRACRIFQEKSAVEIVESLLTERGVAFRLRLQRSYARRPYCVQYHESDYEFIRRLLREEGIFFAFDHPSELGGDTNLTGRGATEVMVLGDSADWCAPIAGGEELALRPAHAAGGLVTDEEAVERFGVRRTLRSRAVHVRRYDFRRPGIPVADAALAGGRTDAGATGAPSAGSASNDFALRTQASYDDERDPEESRTAPVPASVMLEQLRARLAVGKGESSCPRLMPARRFVLRDADPADLSAAYIAVRIEHDGVAPAAQQPGRPVYHNRFECLPASVSPRPPRLPRRIQQVSETATVVGPPGEEIHTDALGRIKVQFHWDREGAMTDRSSSWLRVVQTLAGAGWGAQFIPRVGMEVVVTFLGGDADRPLVTGVVYNGTHPVPFSLPEHKTRSGLRTQSTPGGDGSNELYFEDAKGREVVYLHAERDLQEAVDHDHVTSVGNDAVQTVGGNFRSEVAGDAVDCTVRTRTVLVGDDATERIGGDRHVAVYGVDRDSAAQNRTSSVGGRYTLEAHGGLRTVAGTKDKPQSAELFAWQHWVIGAQKRIRLQAEDGLTLVCGGTYIDIGPEHVAIRSKKVSIEGTAEAALKGNGPALALGKDAEISAKKIRIIAEKSSLELDKDAALDGTKVKLNCKGIDASASSDDGGPKTKRVLLKLTDAEFEPLAAKDWVLVAGSAKFEGTTSGEGKLEVDVPDDAETASLTVWLAERPEGRRLKYDIQITQPPDVSTVKGAQARLRNLGYYWGGDAEGDEIDRETEAALRDFQEDHQLERTGKLDDATKGKLVERAGH
ncbi:MAG: type VI secretion system tip protein VgrG [Myxococcales bacterium]|nr:type VI secretion system tip protein VgrG [Myxococcales bacterium]